MSEQGAKVIKPSPCHRADGVTPKVRYTRRRDAQRAAFIEGDHVVLPYRCPQPPEGCGAWHLGHDMGSGLRRRMNGEGRA